LNQLSLKELQAVDKHFAADVLETFDLTRAMERRNLIGAPGTREVKKQLARWKKQLS
jgi:argininosuccinate lyase